MTQEIKDKIARLELRAKDPELSPTQREAFDKAAKKLRDEHGGGDPSPSPSPKPATKPAPAPKPKKQANGNQMTKVEWENMVIQQIQDDIGASRGDAQGIVEAKEAILDKAWSEKKSAKVTAELIIKAATKPAPAPKPTGKVFVWMEKVNDWEKNTKPITLSNDFRMMEVEEDGYLELREVKTPIKKGDVLLINHLGYPVTFFTPNSTKAHVKPYKELVSEEKLDNLHAELEKAENKLAEKTKEIAELKTSNHNLEVKLDKKVAQYEALAKAVKEKKPAPAPKDDDKPAPAKPKPAPKDDNKPEPKPHDCDAAPDDVEGGELPTAVETWLDGMADGWKERKIHEKVERIYFIKKSNKIVVKLTHYDPLLRKIGTSVKSVANPDYYFLCVETARLTKTAKPEKGSFTVLSGDEDLREIYSTNRNWNACSKLAKATYESCKDGDCSESDRKKYRKMYNECGDTEQKRKNRDMLRYMHAETRKEWKKGEEGYYTAFRRAVSKLKKDASVKWPA